MATIDLITPRSQVAMGAVLEIFAGFIVIGLLSGVMTSLLVTLTSRGRVDRKVDPTSAIPSPSRYRPAASVTERNDGIMFID